MRVAPGARNSAMPFFDSPPEPPPIDAERDARRRRRWLGTPRDTVGVPLGIAPLVARTDEVALFVSVVAYPARFTFLIGAIARPGGPDLIDPQSGRQDEEGLRVGLLFSDGTKLISDGWR